ncbi:MAG: hypothetical protein ACXV5P_01830 [Halobacteriota archaeon]
MPNEVYGVHRISSAQLLHKQGHQKKHFRGFFLLTSSLEVVDIASLARMLKRYPEDLVKLDIELPILSGAATTQSGYEARLST